MAINHEIGIKLKGILRANEQRRKSKKLLLIKLSSEAMDSKYEGKINPPKEPHMGVAKARMISPDRT
jgi:ABC-type taurine transport system ATPase subunit